MNWSRQVVHVTAKDMREMRWALLAYCALVAATMIVAMGWPSIAESGTLSTFLIPVGMCVGAMLVQTDSPSRVDAFWATRPLSPGAVGAAKVLGATIAIVVPGLVAQTAVIVWFRVPIGEIPGMLAISALTYGLLIVAGAVIAVFTPDLKSALITAVVIVVAFFLLSSLRAGDSLLKVPSVFGPVVSFTPLVVLLVAVASQYATRDSRRARGLAVVAGVLVVGLPRLFGVNPPKPKPKAHKQAVVTVVDAKIDTLNRSVRLAVLVPGSQSSDRMEFYASPSFVVYADGHRDTLRLGYRYVDMNEPDLVLDSDVRWLWSRPLGHDTTLIGLPALWFEVSDAQTQALVHGGATLAIAADIRIEREDAPVGLSLRPGARARAPERLFELDSSFLSNSAPFVRIRTAAIERIDYQTMEGDLAYVLLNPGRHEAMWMRESRASFGSVMPLPGVTERAGMSDVSQAGPPRNRGGPPVDAEWMRGAELRIFQWKEARHERVDTIVKVRPGFIERQVVHRSIGAMGVEVSFPPTT